MASECISVSASKQTVGTWCDRENGLPPRHRHMQAHQGAEGDREKKGGVRGIHIYRAFLAFVPRPNAVTTLS